MWAMSHGHLLRAALRPMLAADIYVYTVSIYTHIYIYIIYRHTIDARHPACPTRSAESAALRLYTPCPDHGQHTAHSIQQPKTSKAKMLLPTMGVASSPMDKKGQTVSKKQGYTVGHPYIGVCVCTT